MVHCRTNTEGGRTGSTEDHAPVGASVRPLPLAKLANGKRKKCDIVVRIITTKDSHGQASSRRSTDRAWLRRRRHRAADDALAVASARRATAVAEDARSLFPRSAPVSRLSLRTPGRAGGGFPFCRACGQGRAGSSG